MAFDAASQPYLRSELAGLVLDGYRAEGAVAPRPGSDPDITLHYAADPYHSRFDYVHVIVHGTQVWGFLNFNDGIENLPRWMNETTKVVRGSIRRNIGLYQTGYGPGK